MLISDDYREQQEQLHAAGNYGVTAAKYGRMVSDIVAMYGIQTLLDYGCGSKRSLVPALDCDVVYEGYDPGVAAYAGEPDPAELVVCLDVLEHIEPACLPAVLDHLQGKVQRFALLSVHTGPAAKTLPDGRNAHLIQQPMEWWFPLIAQRLRILSLMRREHEFVVFASVL